MSAPSIETRAAATEDPLDEPGSRGTPAGRARVWCAAGLVPLLLSACLSSNPTQPEDSGRSVSEPVDEQAQASQPESAGTDVAEATTETAPEPKRERRSRRRSRRDEEERQATDPGSADPGIANPGIEVEVPARAAQSYARALAAMTAGNWLEAELELEQLVLEYSSFAGPYVNLAIVYMRDGRDGEARGALEQALRISPAHAQANNQLGILLREQGDFAGAEAAYRTAIETDPEYSLAYYNLGVLLDLYLRRRGEALEFYERYQEMLAEPDDQVALWIIDLRRQIGASDRAERVAQEDGA